MKRPTKPRPVGRPKAATPRTTGIAVRLTPDERAACEAAAARDSRTLSAWLRLVALRAAQP